MVAKVRETLDSKKTSGTVTAIESALARTEPNALKRICIVRLAKAIEELPQAALEQIGTTTTGFGALYQCFIQPEFSDDLKQEDPLAEARIRGKIAAEELLQAEGGYATLSEVANILNMSPQGVNRRRQLNRLIYIDRGTKGVAYPRWQFSKSGKHGVLNGLEDALGALRKSGVLGWSVLSFFLNPHCDLDGETPLNALRHGKTEDVLFAASHLGEMGQ